MRTGQVVIQCRAKGGEIGTFLAEPGGHPEWTPISPVFRDLVALYGWLTAEGWHSLPYRREAPAGEYAKRESVA